jgi:hypothetical protein
MEIQARIPPALCALHNFIRRHDPSDIEDYIDATDLPGGHANGPGIGDLAERAITVTERERAHLERDRIAQAMWDSYQAFVQEGGADLEAIPVV